MMPVYLVILDGWGYAPNWGGNPISIANPQTFNMLWRTYPKTLLQASGVYIGLPGHEAGNSEIGHLNIGAGRIVRLDQTAISESIKSGQFFRNEVLLETIHRAKKNNASVHLMGLISEGDVHSSLDHVYALLEMAAAQKFDKVFIHAFTDGRDSPPQSALAVFEKLLQAFELYKIGGIATVSGRFFAMDRDRHYERTKQVIDAMTKTVGPKFSSPRAAVASAYKQGLSDEYIIPSVITREDGEPVGQIKSNDSVIFFNFRADRARQITRALIEAMPNVQLVTFIPYGFEKELHLKIKSVFKPTPILNGLAQVVSGAGLSQFHIAETEKYAHVTYFFNGGTEEPLPQEERILVASPKVMSFDSKPEMAAREIGSEVVKKINDKRYRLIVVNFASADMVGHTGNIAAAIEAVSVLDEQLKKIFDACQNNGGAFIITADHGNVEQMLNPETGEPDTEHSTNPVPFILVPPKDSHLKNVHLRSSGILADVAPTILEILGLQKPVEMTGTALQINPGSNK